MHVYPNYYKKFHNYIKMFSLIKYKKNICLFNIRMINLSFDELRLIAQIRNISDYENKSKEDLIKALSEIKPETLEAESLKPETPKTEASKISKPEKIKLEVRVNKKKFKKLRKYFDELRHKFSKKEIHRYRKAFCVAKNKKYISKSKKKKANKSFNKLKKSLRFKTFHDIECVDYEDLHSYDYNYDFADEDEYRKIGIIITLFKELDRNYYKPIRTDSGFAEKKW